jgi:hypothetical protein
VGIIKQQKAPLTLADLPRLRKIFGMGRKTVDKIRCDSVGSSD